jgi:methyl-accepting chemotaxis protein
MSETVERGPNYDWKHEAKHYRDECEKLRELLRKVEVSSDERESALEAENALLRGWKALDRKEWPKNYEKLKYCQGFMEELVSEMKDSQRHLQARLSLLEKVASAAREMRNTTNVYRLQVLQAALEALDQSSEAKP